eukprot:TRINITY_DN14344_c0_g1_i1.p1 TRINITY_DN14344_c0_g1~~TRINITY_DN14344_c0_g1_i1.p1  ORF type:complete len:233 (-),score=45.26 TRINITY_DN14344_c0_g1_i1:35-733(-)
MAALPTTSQRQSSTLEHRRRRRELQWADQNTTEAEILEPIIAATGCYDSDERYLQRLLEKIELMVKTNASLEERLRGLQSQASLLKSMVDTRTDQLKPISEAMAESKAEEARCRSQVAALQQNRLKEECRLRALGLQLRKKVDALLMDNLRLEELRRDEDVQIARNYDVLEELNRTHVALQLRKAEFDRYDQELDETLQSFGRLTGSQRRIPTIDTIADVQMHQNIKISSVM